MIQITPIRIEFDRPVKFSPGGRAADFLGADSILGAQMTDGWLILKLKDERTYCIPAARVHCMQVQENTQPQLTTEEVQAALAARETIVRKPADGRKEPPKRDRSKPGNRRPRRS